MPHSSSHYRQGCVPYKPKTKMMDSHKASSLSNSPISTPNAATHFSGSTSSPPACDSSSSSPGGASLRTHSLDAFNPGPSDGVGLFKSEVENEINGHSHSNDNGNLSNGHSVQQIQREQSSINSINRSQHSSVVGVNSSISSLNHLTDAGPLHLVAAAAAVASAGDRRGTNGVLTDDRAPSDSSLTLSQLTSTVPAQYSSSASTSAPSSSMTPSFASSSASAVASSVSSAASCSVSSTVTAFPNIQPRPYPEVVSKLALSSSAINGASNGVGHPGTLASEASGPVMVTDVTGRPHAVITQHDQLRNLAQSGQLVAGEGGQLYLMLPGSGNGTSASDIASAAPSSSSIASAHHSQQQQPQQQTQIQQPSLSVHEQQQILVQQQQQHATRLNPLSAAHNGAVNRILGVQMTSEPCSPAVTPPTPLLQTTGQAISPRPALQPRTEVASAKEEKRRNNHNEVERRRRDRINQWIAELARMLPPEFSSGVPSSLLGDIGDGCPVSPTSAPATPLNSPIATNSSSKGTVLKKVVDYVRQLKVWYQTALQNNRMQEARANSLQQENDQLRREVDKLRTALSQAINVSALVGIDSMPGSVVHQQLQQRQHLQIQQQQHRENGCSGRQDTPMEEGDETADSKDPRSAGTTATNTTVVDSVTR